MTATAGQVTRPADQIGEKLRAYCDRLWYYRSYTARPGPACGHVEASRRRVEAEQPDLMDGLGAWLDLDYGYTAGVVCALRWVTGRDWNTLGTTEPE